MPDRTTIPTAVHAPGETLHGFRIDSVTPLPDLRALAHEATHLGTGARLVHLHCHDPENLFSIGFRTPAPDTTGIAHVLEHCVCCAGSKQFPLRDALGKGGVGMTWSDHTAYFTASLLAKDLLNQARVIVDQVFYPLLTRQIFQREAHHLELVDPDDPGRGLKVSGVVYNEKRSNFDRPQSYILDQVRWHLSPDRPEAVDLGGDPTRIPDLRHEDLVAFHRRYYRPSNARVLLYGDIPLPEHLVFLDGVFAPFERAEVESGYPLQPAWPEPRRIDLPYPSEVGDDSVDRGYVMLAWLLCPSSDLREMLTIAIGLRALVGDRSAPLRKALADSGLGTSPFPEHSFEPDAEPWPWDYLQAWVGIGLRGCDPVSAAAVESLILSTIDRLTRDGLTREQIETGCNHVSYYAREITPQYPYQVMWRAYPAWYYDDDPTAGLLSGQTIDLLREEHARRPRLFDEALRRWLLDNPHRLTVTARPDPGLVTRWDAELGRRMDALAQQMGPEGLARVQEEAEALEAAASEPDSPEALATLPRLTLEDIPHRLHSIPTEVTPYGRVEVLEHPVFTNGILYVGLSFNTVDLTDEESALLPLLGRATLELGAGGLGPEEIPLRIARHTGGISAKPLTGYRRDVGVRYERLAFDTKLLPHDADELASMLADILLKPRDDSLGALRKLVDEASAQAEAHLFQYQNPAKHACEHAAGALNPASWHEAQWSAVLQCQTLGRLRAAIRDEAHLENLAERLAGLQRRIFVRRRAQLSLAADPELLPDLRAQLAALLDQLPEGEPADSDGAGPPAVAPFSGLPIAGRVGFVARVLPAPDATRPAAPACELLDWLLSRHIHRQVRLKGGAYGGMSRYLPEQGLLRMASWRDPAVATTLRVFDAVGDFLRSDAVSDEALEVIRVDVITTFDDVLSPTQQLEKARERHLSRLTEAQRMAYREALYTLGADDIRRLVVDDLERELALAKAPTTVIAPQDQLEAVGAASGRPLELLAVAGS